MTRLAVASRDPAVELVDVAGQLRVVGDSLALHLARVRLPASVLGATRGVVTWPRGTLLYDLRLHADSAALRDFPLIDRRFATAPGSGVVSGEVRVRSHGAALLEVELDPLHVAYRGGTLAGRLTAFAAPDSGLVALRDAALDAHAFDLEFARPFLDTLPFAGRLSGHTTAGGRLAALALSVDWAFRDSLVPGWPETRLRGQGEVNLRARDGIHFQPFTLAATSVDLGTVRRLVPAVRLHGTLSAVGTLSGPLRDAQFSGTLIQRDDGRPPSALAGKVRLDTRGEQLGIYADVTADSLSFDGLRGSFPDLPLHGAVAGPVRLAGPLAALDTHAELHGAGGTVQGDGVLLLDLPHYGARDFVLQAHELDLAHWAVGVPDSRLSFKATASFAGDSGVPPVGALSATLAPSLVKGTPLDSGRAVLRFADRRVYVDSLRIAQPGLISAGAGSLGWQHGTSGSLALDFAADSLGALDAWVGWVAGSAPGEAADGPGVAGSAHVLVTLQGSLDSVAVDARASGERLRWGGWNVTAGRGRLEWRPGPDASLALDATLDSLAHGAVGLAGVVASARGAPDSLAWFARSRVGGGAAFLAGGRFARGRDASRGAVARLGVDSLALQLPGDAWVLERPVTLAATDSAVTVSHLVLRSVYGTGQFVLEGDLPTRGRANAHLQLEAFPLAGLYALAQRDTAGVGGTVTATVGLGGTRRSPVASGAFSLTNGTLGAFHAPFVDGSFDYQERRLRAGVHLWRSGQQILTVEALLPLDLALVPGTERLLPDTLAVRATADSVDLAVLEALTPAVQRVAGVFSTDLGIAGTWDAPRLRGTLRITSAAATIPALAVRYEDVNGRLRLSGDTIAIEALSAKSDRGRADVSGAIRLERLTRPVLDLAIAADQFKALELRNNVAITASGQLRLTGPVFGATLTGRAKVTSGVLYFADLVQKRLVNLDELADTSLASLIARQRLGPEFENVFLDSLRINELELEMGSDVWLRSDEANIQLAGTVTVSKQRSAYRVSGTLQAARGTYRLKVGPVTREFVVSQGTVRYFGTPDQDAALDIEAKHTVRLVPGSTPNPSVGNAEEITVVAHITGTLLVPKVSLAAEKGDVAQTELISYLLFGKSSVDLAGGQGGIADQRALVQSALSVLSGEIEQTIVSGGVPVDYVEIRPGGAVPGDPLQGWQFAVGRQLGPKTFLVVNAGYCGTGQLAVTNALGVSMQYRVSAEWRTEASFEPVLSCSSVTPEGGLAYTLPRQVGLDLFWEKRY